MKLPFNIKTLKYFLIIFCEFHLISCQLYFPNSARILNPENVNHVLNNTSVPVENTVSEVEKRPVNDVETKFFSKSNTIIRTGESRALGAKYINETKLPSHHNCLIWCLETSACNAAVYEEKNMQSCYLFDCGSPAKPLCKFTTHEFFTSSVLKMTQHSYELSQWGKDVQRQREPSDTVLSSTSSSTLESTSTLTSSTVPSISTVLPTVKESACHHYQFQCVNNSECIAIYNVCDGIPQCPDGSDESTEIQCPSKGSSKTKVVASPPSRTMDNNPSPPPPKQPTATKVLPSDSYLDVPQYKKPVSEQQKEDYSERWPNPFLNSEIQKTPYNRQMDAESDGLGSPFVHKHSQFISANDPHVHDLNRWASDYDQYPSPPRSPSVEQQYSPYERMDESYLPNQLPADYDNAKSYNNYRPDDFTYWSNQDGVQDASYAADDFPQAGGLQKIMTYPDKDATFPGSRVDPFSNSKLSMRKPGPMHNPSPDTDGFKMHRYPHSRPYLNMDDLSTYSQMKISPDQTAADNSDNNDDLIRASLVNQFPKKIDQMRHYYALQKSGKDMGHHGGHSTSTPQSETTDNSLIIVKPTPSEVKVIQRTVLDFKMSVAELLESSSTHSHETNSAIVALILGVIVFVLMIFLLACRMRTLRRRLSRKGKSLAHDADYLVNGMYL